MAARSTSVTTVIPTGTWWSSTTARRAAARRTRRTSSARERGLRVLRYDRAGYGGSTPNPGRAVADVVPDMEDMLDALEVDRYVSLGGSGGCPHSFACGALSQRCLAAAAIAAPAPYPAEGLDWLAGMGEQNVAGVEVHISEEDGHLSIAVGRLGEIYDWLAAWF